MSSVIAVGGMYVVYYALAIILPIVYVLVGSVSLSKCLTSILIAVNVVFGLDMGETAFVTVFYGVHRKL